MPQPQKRGERKCQHGHPFNPWWLPDLSIERVIVSLSVQPVVHLYVLLVSHCGYCSIPEVLLAPVHGAGLWLCSYSTPCVGANKALEGPNLLIRLLSEDSPWFSPDSSCPCKTSARL